ncbi:MAG: class I SAM-dependent methyltransferase [Calditrichae bacterium]|nr:class I SAM-dependent methyltransferase [Calditrichota bacterium]MCB9059458.1 class I SAM-dependent methyltransferase [Calditrichia bacterium]
MIKSVLKRIFWPMHLWKAFQLSREKKNVSRSAEDPQLKLYDKILQTDFLHYGYFEDPEIPAEKISLHDIRIAQINYARLIIDQIKNNYGNVLDVGCGMGGLIGMLQNAGFKAYGVTPDRHQISYIEKKYPDAKVIRSKFQKMETEGFETFFDTIINSESLQYISPEKAIPKILSMLKPDGRWIVVDYFRFGEAHEKSGHNWNDFERLLSENHLKIVYKQEITKNILPTLAYIYMWGEQIGKPLFEFLTAKLERKHPGKNYILSEMISELNLKIDKKLNIVNPEFFARDKKYILLTIERV